MPDRAAAECVPVCHLQTAQLCGGARSGLPVDNSVHVVAQVLLQNAAPLVEILL